MVFYCFIFFLLILLKSKWIIIIHASTPPFWFSLFFRSYNILQGSSRITLNCSRQLCLQYFFLLCLHTRRTHRIQSNFLQGNRHKCFYRQHQCNNHLRKTQDNRRTEKYSHYLRLYCKRQEYCRFCAPCKSQSLLFEV